ncbi:MAG: fibronectin type III domain-containing protein [Bacteroidota bacterium]
MLLIAFSGLELGVHAQSNSFIKVIARPAGDSIMLRWAPSSPQAWTLLNKYGYRIERYTITKDGAILENKTLKSLGMQPIKPMPQAAWEKFIDNDDFVAMAAQSIFGDSMIHENGKSNVIQMIHQAREIEIRYSYALFSAEVSTAAAMLSGLRFVDRDVDKKEKYLYRVYSMVPASVSIIDFGFVYSGLADYQPLPEPPAPVLEFADKAVSITWGVSALKDTYTAYHIEKSEDGGKTFRRIDKAPMVPIVTEKDDPNNLKLTKTDTLTTNDQVVHYRIIGLTSFGETSPPSKVASGQGIVSLKGTVSKLQGVPTLNGPVALQWEFPEEDEKMIAGFEMERGRKADGPYTVIGSVLSTSRTYQDSKPLPVNYYRVIALGRDKKRRATFPILVQLEDSIPPSAPQMLKAKVDTTGIVSLSWKANTEADLLGYRVFRSNFRNSEFSQITTDPVSFPEFKDTVDVNTLSSKIFYKIVAVDIRFNPSIYSTVLEVEKPDLIPPVPPVIKSVRAGTRGIELIWARSSSEDLAAYEIYRKNASTEWKLLKALTLKDSAYVDNSDDLNQKWEYRLKAIDKKGLSSFSASVTARGRSILRPGVKNLKSEVDRTNKSIRIRWSTEDTDITKYLIYRAQGNDGITLYRSIGATEKAFTDQNLEFNKQYTYRIKTVFANGSESSFSEEIKVNY